MVTYESSRLDALRSTPNCDSQIAEACYQFGKATIASAIDRNFADYYQAGANSAFRTAIHDGLALAMDQSDTVGDPGHTPWDGHARKIYCTMGTPMDWVAMGMNTFQTSTPLAAYAAGSGTMLRIIREAVALDPVCASGSNARCWSSAPTEPGIRKGGHDLTILGSVWSEVEAGIRGTWTRRGDTNVFDGKWANGAIAVLEMSLEGKNVTISRYDPAGVSAGFRITYKGTISADGRTVSGKEYWPGGIQDWSATIR